MVEIIRNQWYKLSIKNKLLIFFGVIVSFIAITSLYLNNSTYGFMDEFNSNLNTYYDVNRLQVLVAEHRQAVERYLKNTEEDYFIAYNEKREAVNLTLALVDRESSGNKEAYFLIRAIRNALSVYYDECNKAILLRSNREDNYYINFSNASKISQYIEGYITNLLYIHLREGSRSYSILESKAHNMRVITFLVLIAIVFLLIWFSVKFSSYLSLPIRKLAKASKRISIGDLDVDEIKVYSEDEVSILANSFNKMAVNIKQMVNDLKNKAEIERKLHEEELNNIKTRQLLKEAEFISLQSQINPHFLFNTLNIISRTAMFENANTTTKLIQYLSNLFRYNLGKEKSITLSKELDIVKKYMFIQQYRFGERIRYDLQCSVDGNSVYIPRLTIQPLIENAIIHGIEPKEEGGHIRIKIFEKDYNVIIKIIDNGIGMTRERISEILNCTVISHPGHTTGIGISNIINRIKLYHNCENCFKISSRKGIGTVIKINIPINKGGVDNSKIINS